MADPFTAFTVVAGVVGAVGQRAQAMDESARLQSEARLADTQALQRDTIARDELNRYLGSFAAARAANGLSQSSPNANLLTKEAIETADKDRLIQRADDRQRAANFRTAAKSARKAGNFSLITGIGKAAVPLADYASTKGYI